VRHDITQKTERLVYLIREILKLVHEVYHKMLQQSSDILHLIKHGVMELGLLQVYLGLIMDQNVDMYVIMDIIQKIMLHV